MRTHTRSEADSGRGGATVIDSFTPKFQDIGEPGLKSGFVRNIKKNLYKDV